MPLRALLRYLLNNEQLIQKLSESYPIKRAAQLTAFMFHRGREMGEDTLKKMQESDALHKFQEEMRQSGGKLSTFKDTFSKEMKEGFKRIEEQKKKQR